MLFAVLLQDVPENASAIRREHLPSHLDFLDANGASIRAAGPLRQMEGAAAGGLWLVEAADRQEVERLIKADPFWDAGLRQSTEIFIWDQVFAEGVRLLPKG